MIFNRPQKTNRVFEEIAKIKPRKLFVIADGPRFPEEVALCEQSRSVIEKVNWECDVQINFSSDNMGCKKRISSGLSWVFSQCEESIMLEDDCLPNQSFFLYCDELLNYYRTDERIMVVSGNNFQKPEKSYRYSYYYSIYPHNWGWATWARAWRNYDVSMSLWPQLRATNWLFDLHHDTKVVKYWQNIFDEVYQGKIDTWDYQWTFANWVQHGLSTIPEKNLVTNIGFDQTATHTIEVNSNVANLRSEMIDLPLTHPPCIVRDFDADYYVSQTCFLPPQKNLFQKMKEKASRFLKILAPNRKNK